MSNVIDFIERMGQDAQLRYATTAEVEEALKDADIEPALRSAVLSDGPSRLEALLGAPAIVCSMVRPSEDDPEDDDEDFDEDDDEDDDDDDDEDDDEDETDALSSDRTVARCATAAS